MSARHCLLAVTGLVTLGLLGACDRSPTAPAADYAPSSAINSTGRYKGSPATTCASPVTSAPTGPATVSAKSTPYGRVLEIGSGEYAGCSLYLLTSDQLHSLTRADFACSDNSNAAGEPCDAVLWPALLTKGAPIAGPGVNPTLLGTVTRNDFPDDVAPGPVQQVTYAGYPLYRFFLDEAAGETDGANLFDNVVSPTGIWYLVEPSRGRVGPGTAHVRLETAPLDGTSSDQTVLAVSMNDGFVKLPNAPFPVYTLSNDSHEGGHRSTCQGQCSVYWPPVLTSNRPEAGPGVDQHALGIIVRPDGTHQVTYNGKPLYLYINDAYIPGLGGSKSINGAGLSTPWGTFNTIPSLP